MPYVKKGTRPGRPKVHAPGHEPRSIGLRLPRPLFTTLDAVAKTQRTSMTAIALQAGSCWIPGSWIYRDGPPRLVPLSLP
jgi:hypothetical protein